MKSKSKTIPLRIPKKKGCKFTRHDHLPRKIRNKASKQRASPHPIPHIFSQTHKSNCLQAKIPNTLCLHAKIPKSKKELKIKKQHRNLCLNIFQGI